jgi:hypothetical protein
MFRWFEEGKLHPTTSHRFRPRDYAAALDAVPALQTTGKLVLEMPRARSLIQATAIESIQNLR